MLCAHLCMEVLELAEELDPGSEGPCVAVQHPERCGASLLRGCAAARAIATKCKAVLASK